MYLKGTPYADGLLKAIRPHQVIFRKAIRATAPRFCSQTDDPECDGRAYVVASVSESEGDDAAYIEAATFAFLANEEDAREFGPLQDDTNVISILDVMKRADEYVAACFMALSVALTIIQSRYTRATWSLSICRLRGIHRLYNRTVAGSKPGAFRGHSTFSKDWCKNHPS